MRKTRLHLGQCLGEPSRAGGKPTSFTVSPPQGTPPLCFSLNLPARLCALLFISKLPPQKDLGISHLPISVSLGHRDPSAFQVLSSHEGAGDLTGVD